MGRDGESVAAVARSLGTGWHTIMAAVGRRGQPLVDDPARLEGVEALGMDETAWLRASRTRHTQFVSGLVDTASERLLDVVADRTALGSHALAGPAANGAGWPRSAWSPSTPIGAMPVRWPPTWPMPRSWWTTST